MYPRWLSTRRHRKRSLRDSPLHGRGIFFFRKMGRSSWRIRRRRTGRWKRHRRRVHGSTIRVTLIWAIEYFIVPLLRSFSDLLKLYCNYLNLYEIMNWIFSTRVTHGKRAVVILETRDATPIVGCFVRPVAEINRAQSHPRSLECVEIDLALVQLRLHPHQVRAADWCGCWAPERPTGNGIAWFLLSHNPVKLCNQHLVFQRILLIWWFGVLAESWSQCSNFTLILQGRPLRHSTPDLSQCWSCGEFCSRSN